MRRRHRWSGFHPPRPRLARWLDDLRQDLAYAVRHLARAPGLAALVVLTLAVGIGANVTMAGIVDRLLLRGPEGVHRPGELARLLAETPGANPAAPRRGGYASWPLVLELARDVPAFSGVAAVTHTRLPLGEGPDAPEVEAALVSASYFPVLGTPAALGRTFGPGDGYPSGATAGGPTLAVLAHGFWQRQMGGDPGVVGRAVRIGTLTYTVVGVAPPRFRGLGEQVPDVWLPLHVAADAEMRRHILEEHGMSWLTVIARLRPGVARALAEEQATAVWTRDLPPIPAYEGTRVLAASVIRGRAPDRPREVNVALWLAGVSSLVLLIACANVTNLLLARAFARRREIAVRLALGASRGRLARQLLAEAGVLAALAAAGALLLASIGARVLGRWFEADIGSAGFVDARLVAFAAVVALGLTIVVGLAPLALSALPDLSQTMRAGATQGGGRSAGARGVLLGAQAAMCMVLLVVAGLFARSLGEVTGLDLGMEPDRTIEASFDLDKLLMTNDERDATYAGLRERVAAIPGVARVAFAYDVSRAVHVRSRLGDTSDHLRRYFYAPIEQSVDSGFFTTLGSSLRGRDFDARDGRSAPRVAILNEPMARELFPGADPLGECIHLPTRNGGRDDTCVTVVGVLHGFYYRRGILERDQLLVYVPMAQHGYGLGRPGRMVVALDGPAAAVIPAMRAAILDVRPDLARVHVRWMRDVVEPELRPWRLAAGMFSLFGLVALAVAAVGLYAVVSFAAVQRSAEIAVRLALGARRRDVLATVAGDGLRAVVAGLLVGGLLALVARGWIAPLLFRTSASDPGVMAAVAALLLCVALVAAVVPTLRAARRSPAEVLRAD